MDAIRKLYNNIFKKSSAPPEIQKSLITDDFNQEELQLVQKTSNTNITGRANDTKVTSDDIDQVFTTQTQKYTVAKRSVEKLKVDIERWVPKDHLKKEYESKSEIVGKVPSLLYKVKEAEQKIRLRQEQANKNLNKEFLSPYDRMQILELKQDIMREEGRLADVQEQLEQARELSNDPIFEEWANYISAADDFISKNPELRGSIDSYEILSSQGIYFRAKALMDQIVSYAPSNPKRVAWLEKLAILDIFFDLELIHLETCGKFLKDLYIPKERIFDKLGGPDISVNVFNKIPVGQRRMLEAPVKEYYPVAVDNVPTTVDNVLTTVDNVITTIIMKN